MKHKGLIHVRLIVRDLNRSVDFYERAFGLKVILRHEDRRLGCLQTPGTGDVLTLSEGKGDHVGVCAGSDRIGFPLEAPAER